MEPIAAADLAAAMNRLWTRFLPQIRERVAILESAAAAHAANHLPHAQRQAAAAAAHKLAGTLGTFNLTRGTVLARELELLYASDSGPEQSLTEKLASIAAELRQLVDSRPQA